MQYEQKAQMHLQRGMHLLQFNEDTGVSFGVPRPEPKVRVPRPYRRYLKN